MTQDMTECPGNRQPAEAELVRLLAIMARLRDPETGCPWDVAQTFASIAPYTLEEAYEVQDAIQRAAWEELPAELGDLLLQVVFHARMAQEAGLFDFADVARAISDKMIARHPHVFDPDAGRMDERPQSGNWESLKADERGAARTLDGVALALPALLRAVKLQKRAARVGFDWPSIGGVLAKLQEEAAELVEAREKLGPAEIREEMGDLLFVIANLARHLHVDPEAALREANDKFSRRFARIEDWLAEDGRRPDQSYPDELDMLWDRAKEEEKTIGHRGVSTRHGTAPR